jgi:hypothetical protein
MVIVRFVWSYVEYVFKRWTIEKSFKRHVSEFKQQYGPYGIRIVNKAEKEWRVKASLAEVFTSDKKKLKRSVEQLEAMDALFKVGMQPEGDEFLLHDLKLKYGKFRLEQFNGAL